jgi:hypothetical protein
MVDGGYCQQIFKGQILGADIKKRILKGRNCRADIDGDYQKADIAGRY